MKQVIHCNRAAMVTHLRAIAKEHWHAAESFSPRGLRAANERGIAAGLDVAADIIGAWEEAGEIGKAGPPPPDQPGGGWPAPTAPPPFDPDQPGGGVAWRRANGLSW